MGKGSKTYFPSRITDEELRDFFPLPRVVTAVFRLVQNLFDITIEEVKDPAAVQAWNESVKLFRVSDAGGEELGHFYFDPYIRDDKSFSGGDRGWYVPVRPRSRAAKCRPVGAMVLSLPQPGYGKPSLLNFAEVDELLRNIGSMLVHLLSAGRWSDTCGKTGVEWDALDVAPRFMTHWLRTPDLLQALARHWSSNEPLAQGMVEKLCQADCQLAGYDLCQELYRSAFDLAFHSE